jgi:site-specific DNA recombinase
MKLNMVVAINPIQPIIYCARYIRISTDKKEQKTSIPHQKSYLEEHVKYKSQTNSEGAEWVAPEEMVYIDEDFSAYKKSIFDRPQFKKLLADAKLGKFQVVLFKSISRLARDTQESLAISSEFESLGILVIAPDDKYESDQQNAKFMFTISSAFAEQESVNKAISVSTGNKQKAKSGKWSNSRPPFGYKVNSETKKLEVGDEQQVKTVHSIFDLYTNEGWGTFKVAEYLNEKKWLTANNKLWSRTTVRQVLVNRAYVGDIVYGKTRNKITRSIEEGKKMKTLNIPEEDWAICMNAHPAIIERNIFNTAQHILKSRQLGIKKKRLVHPLTGILKCGICDEGMICQKRSSQWGEYRYYICKTYHKYGRKACPQSNIRAGDIENFVLDWLRETISKYKVEADMNKVKTKEKSQKELQKELDKINKTIEKANKDTLDLFKMRDNFTEEQYNYANEELKKEIDLLREKRNHYEEEFAKINGEDNEKRLKEIMDNFLSEEKLDENDMRKYVQLLLKEVVLNDEELDFVSTFGHYFD